MCKVFSLNLPLEIVLSPTNHVRLSAKMIKYLYKYLAKQQNSLSLIQKCRMNICYIIEMSFPSIFKRQSYDGCFLDSPLEDPDKIIDDILRRLSEDQNEVLPELRSINSSQSFTTVFKCKETGYESIRPQPIAIKEIEEEGLTFEDVSDSIFAFSQMPTRINEVQAAESLQSIAISSRPVRPVRPARSWRFGQKIRPKKGQPLIKATIKHEAIKSKRVGKNSQSEAQRFLTLAHGFYYTKNFEQYYSIRLSQTFESQKDYDKLEAIQKVEVIDYIIDQELPSYRFTICKLFRAEMETEFNAKERQFVTEFFESLFVRVYEIMFGTQRRRILKRSQEKEGITSQYFDVQGEKDLKMAFETVYEEVSQKHRTRSGNLDYQRILSVIRKLMQ